jgi:hypothetical protein
LCPADYRNARSISQIVAQCALSRLSAALALRFSRAANAPFAIVSSTSRLFGHDELVHHLHYAAKNAIRQTDTLRMHQLRCQKRTPK